MRNIRHAVTSLVLAGALSACGPASESAAPQETGTATASTEAVQALQQIDHMQLARVLESVQAYKAAHPEASEAEVSALTQAEVIAEASRVRSQELDYYKYSPIRLNAQESALCNENYIKCTNSINVGKQAVDVAPYYFSDGQTEGRQDAFRHAFWNAQLVRVTDLTWAQRWATAHEDGYSANFYSNGIRKPPSQMDMQNNASGRTYGSNNRYVNDTQMMNIIRDAVIAGNLVALKYTTTYPDGYLVRTSTCLTGGRCGRN